MNYRHVSVDIETLDTESSAMVVSVGLVQFNLEDEETYTDILSTPERHLYFSLDLEEQQQRGRTINHQTVAWWMGESAIARNVFNEPRISVELGLELMSEFCKNTAYLWGNGNMFDNAILRSLYKSFEKPFPYKYSRDMDLRTLRLIGSTYGTVNAVKNDEGFIKHHALHDAIKQAVSAQMLWRMITRA